MPETKPTIKELLEKWPKAYAVKFEDGWTATAVKYNDVTALARSHEALRKSWEDLRVTLQSFSGYSAHDGEVRRTIALIESSLAYKDGMKALAEAEKVSQ